MEFKKIFWSALNGTAQDGAIWQIGHLEPFYAVKGTFFQWVVFLGLIAFFSGCKTAPARPKAQSTATDLARNNLYSLLYDLLGDEKDVSKLRFIKREDSDVKQLLNEIAAVARKGHLELEAFAKVDPSLHLDVVNLPVGETQTRKDIAAATEHQLLHESGPQLELDLLLNQIEALRYGAHLAALAGKNDFNPDRSRFLAELSGQLQGLHDKAVAHLALSHSAN